MTPHSFTGLAIIVVNFGSHELLLDNLGPMSAQLPGAHCVVVDNWFSDAERKACESVCSQFDWTLIGLDSNTGFGAGCNEGARAAIAAGAQNLLFLNPDAHIDADSLSLLLAAARNEPRSLVAPRVLKTDGSLWSAGMDIDLHTGDSRGWHKRSEHPDVATIEWFTGACLLISSSMWTSVGGFDDDYFLYWEDVDLSARVQARGGRLILVPEATAFHDVGGTQEANPASTKSESYYYYNIRNRSLFARKHLGEAQRRVWRDSARSSAWQIILRGGRRQFLRPLKPLRALRKGLRDSDYGV